MKKFLPVCDTSQLQDHNQEVFLINLDATEAHKFAEQIMLTCSQQADT